MILRTDERRVTSRGDFAGWLAANDLLTKARECTARRIPAGNILVWLDVDTADVAVASFLLVDVLSFLS